MCTCSWKWVDRDLLQLGHINPLAAPRFGRPAGAAESATEGTSCRVLRNLAVAVAVHLLKGSVFGAAVPILDAVTV